MQKQEKRTKVIVVISNVDKSVGFEWLVENLDHSRFDLSFILLNDKPSYLAKYLAEKNIRVRELEFRLKSDIPKLTGKLWSIFRREKPDAVHTHLFAANLIGQSAARFAGVRKRIYTRHSSNENRRYHNKQWIDKLVNRLVTHVIAISENVRNVLINEENVPERKIRLLHHGFDLKLFDEVSPAQIERLANEYNPNSRRPVIGVIARYSHWKGIQFVIPAFQRLWEDEPNALLILANAKHGDYAKEIDEKLKTLPAGSYREIEFEHDLFALYRLFDVYVHVPIDAELEAFGQTYVEALASGVPSVFTLSGVAPEFIEHERNALVVDFENSDETFAAMKRLLEDRELRQKLIANGREDVAKLFSIEKMIDRLQQIYSE
jgi:glycosyltransferase involved in cell wall biosynthesis